MHDLVIRGGQIVDGTGADAFTGDVAIDGGTISAVGKVAERGRREIDASGLLVTPGFVDIHTHYDGQVSWDAYVTPSSWHGVTTAVMGNCGVGFAPVRPQDHDELIRLMEGVEDIPGTALSEGITWGWEGFPEYLDAIERTPHALDIGAQIPHGPLRVFVMGERGIAREPATADDIAEMGRLVKEAIMAGALGFTTSRTVRHRTATGELTPMVTAEHDELHGIGRAMAAAGRGVIEMVSDLDPFEDEFGMMTRLARETGRPLSVTLLQRDTQPDGWRRLMRGIEEAAGAGVPITGQVAPRPIGLLLGLESSANPFLARPSYQAIRTLPLEARVRLMRDPALRARILSEKPERARSGAPFLTNFDRLYPLGDPPDYEPAPETSIGAIARAQGRDPDAVAYDLLLENDGHTLLYFPLFNYSDGDLDAAREMMLHPNTVFGLSDGGAHCGIICDASVPTYVLTHWARDRRRGEKLPVEWLVKSQTRDTARHVGLLDRGLVAPGMKADLNVIDFDRLGIAPPEMVYDLPAKGRRLVQRARGYRATIVSGVVTRENDEATGALPGILVRGAQTSPAARAAQ